MVNGSPVDYLVSGFLKAIYSISPNGSINHAINAEYLKRIFFERFDHYPISDNMVDIAIKRMEHLGVLSVVVDPYAETIIEITDSAIANFIATTDIQIFLRSWKNEDWLNSAFANEKLWIDIEKFSDDIGLIEAIPSSDGFVRIDHNSSLYVEAENALVNADEALRGDNEFDADERSWIRIHFESGLGLLKRGGPVLRSALLALIIDPLKAAIKATTNEKVKSLIGLALNAFLKWFGL